MDQFSGRRFLVDAGAISSSPSAVPGSRGQAASSPSAGPDPHGQAASSPSAGPDPFGQASTPTQEVFDSTLILNGQFLDSPELFSGKFCRQIFRTMSAAEHFSLRHNTSAVPGPHGRAASSPTAVPGPHSLAASSSSFSSPSAIGRRPPAAGGGQAAAKPGGHLAYQLLFFFLFLQLDQDDAYPSKIQCFSPVPGRRISVQGLVSSAVPGRCIPVHVPAMWCQPPLQSADGRRPPDWVTDFDSPAWNRFSWHICQVFCTPRLVSLESKSGRGPCGGLLINSYYGANYMYSNRRGEAKKSSKWF